jgi:tight adherence protein B
LKKKLDKSFHKSAKKRYRINPATVWGGTVLLCGAVFLCAYVLFVDVTVSLMIAAAAVFPLMVKVRRGIETKYERTMRKEFVASLVFISGSLSSGVRLEQCINELAISTSSEYAHLRPEFERMSKLIQLNMPAERAFAELADRVPVSDIVLFSQALDYAIPAGVNLIELVRSFSSGMRIRNDVEAEITRTLNLPRYNNRIITVMPFFMIGLMRFTAADYLSGLDGGIGNIVKIIVAAIIIGAVVLGELLGNIRYAE